MSVTTMWTHGNSLVVEDHGEYSSIRHRGWGTELNYNPPRDFDDTSYRACHIPIPTPTSVDGATPMLTKLTILFETTSDLLIVRLDVWDANDGVAQFNSDYGTPSPPPGWLGNGSHLVPDRTNQLTINPPYPVQYGIGVSFLASFIGGNLQLNVAAVGADFVFPNPPIIEGRSVQKATARKQSAVKPAK